MMIGPGFGLLFLVMAGLAKLITMAGERRDRKKLQNEGFEAIPADERIAVVAEMNRRAPSGDPLFDDFWTETVRAEAAQGRVRNTLARMGVQLTESNDKKVLCAEASTAIVCLIARTAKVSTVELHGREQFLFGILAAVAVDVVDQLITSKFDNPKLECEDACLMVIAALLGAEYVKNIYDLWDQYNELASENSTIQELGATIQELGTGIKAFINESNAERLKVIGRTYAKTRDDRRAG